MQMHNSIPAQNACIQACTGYGTQPSCPPLIVIATATARHEENEMKRCLLLVKDTAKTATPGRKVV
jgi:predicted metal-binding protein